MLIQIDLPFPMPVHLTASQVNVSRCTFCCSELNAATKSEECSIELDYNVICANCVTPITYDEYTLSVLDTAQSKLASKKRASTTRNSNKKRSRIEDDEFLVSKEKRVKYFQSRDSAARTAMDCMHQAVGLQHARRALRSSKEAALDDLSAAFDFDETGSALLLELKENSKATEGHISAGSSHGGGATSSSDSPVAHSMALRQQTLGWEPLRIITSPYEKPSTPELASGPNTHDFLLACYRDGIYPSPVLPMNSGAAAPSTGAGIFDQHVFTHNSLHGEAAASYSTGTEVDAGDDAAGADSTVQVPVISCLTAGMTFAASTALELKSSPKSDRHRSGSPCTRTLHHTDEAHPGNVSMGNENDTTDAASAEPSKKHLAPLSQSPTPPQQQQQQQQQQSPLPSFGYDELQQLLTHLLCDARD